MNGTPSHEKLSAWLDDELTLDERAEVEKLLAESPELRQELNELQRLSGRLKGLPVGRAPAELQQAVMRAIERETLLANDDSAVVTRQGRRLRVFTTAAGIALALGAGIWLTSNRGSELAVVNPAGPEIVTVERNSGPVMQANRPDLKHKQLSVELPTRQFEIDRTRLGAVDIGDIVEAVRRDGESVSIIRLTVVDRVAGLESLRVLLAHEDIPLDGSTNPVVPGDKVGKGLVAVFVESKSSQLSRTIEQMARGFDMEALSVSDALPIAELDSSLRQELGLADSSEEPRSSRAVSVQEGSPLGKMISESGSYASSSESSGKPVASDRPVRVIFVLTDAPTTEPAAKAATPGNGAA
ncbi:MAG: hypothetical protein HQ518_19995 [Rhodopirellula sp.]|nr:hypothetical protein [Rhodopirellula sp.]